MSSGIRKRRPWDERTREKIKVGRLITNLMKCADGTLEMSMTRLRAIEILLRKVVPDLSRTIVQADVNIDMSCGCPMCCPGRTGSSATATRGRPETIDGTVEPPEILQ